MNREHDDIAIAGAGIAGLAIGRLLSREGFRVRVYEQARCFARVGAGIQMTPNAVMALRGMGLDAHACDVAFHPQMGLAREFDTGDVTNELRMSEFPERYGAPHLCMHRGDLHHILASDLPGDLVSFGKRIVACSQQDELVSLAFADGSTATARALIGADGIHSAVRRQLFGDDTPLSTGKISYRAIVPAALIKGAVSQARVKWWGPDRHIVVYYNSRAMDEVYFGAIVPESTRPDALESWSAIGDIAELRRLFEGFHPEVLAILDACESVNLYTILEREPIESWGTGRISLIGDACHPMTPFMSQGGAQSLEDAAILYRCIREAGLDCIDQAFQRYASIRRPRTADIQTTSRKNTWMRRATNPDWLYGYDAWLTPLDAPSEIDRLEQAAN